jgi:hypothetical protein
MPLTDSQAVRLRIQDQPLRADTTYLGDGTAVSFGLPQRNISSGSAFVPGPGGWSATGATFDATGFVTFGTAHSANSAFRTVYVYSVFSDAEIDQMLADGGTVLGASIEAVKTLMFDGVKRSIWKAPDGTTYDDTDAMEHLRSLFRLLEDERANTEGAAAGGMTSWSLNQGDY